MFLDHVSYSWYIRPTSSKSTFQGTWTERNLLVSQIDHVTGEHIGHVTEEHVSRVTDEQVGRVIGDPVSRVISKHIVGQVTGEHVGPVTGEHIRQDKHNFVALIYFLWKRKLPFVVKEQVLNKSNISGKFSFNECYFFFLSEILVKIFSCNISWVRKIFQLIRKIFQLRV